jgi:hypothetical protein
MGEGALLDSEIERLGRCGDKNGDECEVEGECEPLLVEKEVHREKLL